MAVGSDSVRLFADDTIVFMHDTDLNDLIIELTEKVTELYKWCVRNNFFYYCMRSTNLCFINLIKSKRGL